MLESDTDALVRRFQESRPKALRSDCPAPEQLWAAVSGNLSLEELRQTTTHTARCAECSEALRIALELQRAAARPAAPGVVVPLRARRQRLLAFSGAGLLAAGLAAVVLVHGRDLPSSALTRDAERGEAAAAIASRTPPGRQPRNEVHLRWTAYPNALHYNVSVMTPSLQLLHRALGVSTTDFKVPPEALSGQPAGARLLWSVEAALPDGRIVESAVFPLQLD